MEKPLGYKPFSVINYSIITRGKTMEVVIFGGQSLNVWELIFKIGQ